MVRSLKRDGLKLEFIEKHKNIVMQAFKEAEALSKEYKEIRESKMVSDLINIARIELKYSPKTYAKDIFYGLLRTYRRHLEQ
jgi:hypothetical protein